VIPALRGEIILLLGGYPDPGGASIEPRRLGERRDFEDEIGNRVREATLSLLRAAFARGATVAMIHEPAVLPLAIAVASEYLLPEAAEPRPGEPSLEDPGPKVPLLRRRERPPIALVDYFADTEPRSEPDTRYFDEDVPPLLTPVEAARAMRYLELVDDPLALRPAMSVCIGGSVDRVRVTLERFAYEGQVFAITSTSGAGANLDLPGGRASSPEDRFWSRVRESERDVLWPEEGNERPDRGVLRPTRSRESMYPLLMSMILDTTFQQRRLDE
jgi:hypothetical protein